MRYWQPPDLQRAPYGNNFDEKCQGNPAQPQIISVRKTLTACLNRRSQMQRIGRFETIPTTDIGCSIHDSRGQRHHASLIAWLTNASYWLRSLLVSRGKQRCCGFLQAALTR